MGESKAYGLISASRKNQYLVRKIKPSDLKAVYALLLDLIKHEKLEHAYKYTFEKVQEDLFGANADWHCLVACIKDEIIGFCFYSYANTNRVFNYSPLIQVDDIYVNPSYRGKNIGKKLLQELALIASEKGIRRIELWCMKDNEVGQAFYRRLNPRYIDTIDVIRLDVSSLLEEVVL